MPILSVEIVGETPLPGLAGRLADAVADVLQASPGTVWVKLRRLRPENYAENGSDLPPEIVPVFVSILNADLPDSAELEDQARLLTEAIARAIGCVPENVHLVFEPAARGRISFGGTLRQ